MNTECFHPIRFLTQTSVAFACDDVQSQQQSEPMLNFNSIALQQSQAPAAATVTVAVSSYATATATATSAVAVSRYAES